MQRLTRRSSALSEQSDKDAHESPTDQFSSLEVRPKKRTTVEIRSSLESGTIKRARRIGSKSGESDVDTGDCVVVSSQTNQDHRGSILQTGDGDAPFTLPVLTSSLTSPPQRTDLINARLQTKLEDVKISQNSITDCNKRLGECSNQKHSACALSGTPKAACSGESLSNLLSLDKDDSHDREKLVERPYLDEKYLVTSVPYINTGVLALEASINDQPIHLNSGSILPAHNSTGSCSIQGVQISPNNPMTSKRTPLPTEKVEVQGNASRLLSNIVRDPRYKLTKTPTSANFTARRASSTPGIEKHKNSAIVTSKIAASTINSHGESQPLHIVSSSGDIETRQLCTPVCLSTDLSIVMSVPSIRTLASSTSTENGSACTIHEDSQAFTTFPSKFQVYTTHSVQKSQAPKQKRRHKRNAASQTSQDIIAPTVRSQLGTSDQSPSSMAQKSGSNDNSFLKSILARQTSFELNPKHRLPSLTIHSMPSEVGAGNRSQIQLPPIHTIHGELPASQVISPPAVGFTVDNRAESVLPPAEVTALVESLSKNASIVIPHTDSSSPVTGAWHPIGVIMWQTLQNFYSWYGNTTGLTTTNFLEFELVDVHWQTQKSFRVPHGNLNYFRALKQHIWDLYWTANSVNNGILPFRVSVTTCSIDTKESGEPSPGSKVSDSKNLPNLSIYQYKDQILPWNRLKQDASHPSSSDSPSNNRKISLPDRILEPTSSVSTENTLAPLASPLENLPSLKISNASPTIGLLCDSAQSTPAQSSPQITHWHSHSIPRQSIIDTQMGHTDTLRLHFSRPTSESSNAHLRTDADKAALRRAAIHLLPADAELLPEESTVFDKFPYRTGSQVIGAVIDTMSGKGIVTITGKGYSTLNMRTGFDEGGERYQSVRIHSKQTCMLHNGAVVLFYKRRIANDGPERTTGKSPPADNSDSLSSHDNPLSARRSSLCKEVLDDGSIRDVRCSISTPQQSSPREVVENILLANDSLLAVEIFFRIQINRSGKFSVPFDKSILRPSITVRGFFSWFASKTGHAEPGPAALKFTFKDAMPAPTSTQVMRGNEDHFKYMRKDIKSQCAKAKVFMPELKEFTILITVPGWDDPSEEDW